MTVSFSKRTWVKITVLFLAIIATLGIFLYMYYQKYNKLQLETKYSYMRSIAELGSYVDNINTNLAKANYAGTSEQLVYLTASIWRESGYAKNSLTQLPISYLGLENTKKLLSQVGEYTRSLAEKVSDGEELSMEDRDNIKQLQEYCTQLHEELIVLEDQIATGSINLADIIEKADLEAESDEIANFTDGFKSFEDGIDSYPTLIYDGPFSDHLTEKEPEYIKNMEEVTQDEAKATAAAMLGVEQSGLNEDSDEEGKMPLYRFYTDTTNVSVTKQGGKVAYILDSRMVYETSIDIEVAKDNAKAFLNERGIDMVEETYYELNNNILTINYAKQDDAIRCYTDLVKINVAMDNGEILSFDGRSFLMNSHERDYPENRLTEEQAMESLSPVLQIEKSQLALIPTDGENEILTYEFNCIDESNQRVLVYVNVESGKEERILILIENANGVLTT